MHKRERLERACSGEAPDRPPVALWRHWPGDDQRAADLAASVLAFQKTYDWDFVNIVPASTAFVIDYGVQDQWDGALDGTRTILKRPIERSLDWTALRTLDPLRGSMGRLQECLHLVIDALGDETPILLTMPSPLMQADQLTGRERLLKDMRIHPDRLHSGLSILTESLLRLIDAMRRTPIAGIYYDIQHASYTALSEEEYRTFGLLYDRRVLDSIPERWWLNVSHLRGDLPMMKFASEFKTQVINWRAVETDPELAQGRTLFDGAVCGGLATWEHLHQGTPSIVRDAARLAMERTGNRRFILGAGCSMLIGTPLSNIRAARKVVED